MELIETYDQLIENLKAIDHYLAVGNEKEKKEVLRLIANGTCFIPYEIKGDIKFAPSRFLGYQNNSLYKHNNNPNKDGKETNVAISKIIEDSLKNDINLESKYSTYCEILGKSAANKKHRFWKVIRLDNSLTISKENKGDSLKSDLISTSQYLSALQIEGVLNTRRKQLLQVFLNTPDEGLTATQIGEYLQLDYSNINLRFGRLGREISKALNVPPPIRKDHSYQWWQTIATREYHNGGFKWTLRKNFIEALLQIDLSKSESKSNLTGYWMFISNPKTWKVDDFLRSGETEGTWKVTNWQASHFTPGQQGIIRIGVDKRNKIQLNGKPKMNSGVYALVEITSTAKPIPFNNDKSWGNPEDYDEKSPRVYIKIIKNLIDNPILIDDLKNNPLFFSERDLLKGREASSWPISKDLFLELQTLASQYIKTVCIVKSESIETLEDLQELDKKYANAPLIVKKVLSNRIERGSIAQKIKKINNYECQICKAQGKNIHGFKKRNGEHYIETHHVELVSQNGSLGLSNLMTVCANHHRQLHYGKSETNIFENHFEIRIDNEILNILKTRF